MARLSSYYITLNINVNKNENSKSRCIRFYLCDLSVTFPLQVPLACSLVKRLINFIFTMDTPNLKWVVKYYIFVTFQYNYVGERKILWYSSFHGHKVFVSAKTKSWTNLIILAFVFESRTSPLYEEIDVLIVEHRARIGFVRCLITREKW